MSNIKLIWMINLIVLLSGILLACTPPTPPPSPTPWPTETSTPVVSAITATPIANQPATPTESATSPATPSATMALPVTTITVWESLPPNQAQQLAEEVEAFQQTFPNYQVELHHYESQEIFINQLQLGEADFQVVLASPPLLSQLWALKQLAPMSDFFSSSFIDKFAGVTLQGASRDDELWGLSDTAGFHLLLFYNRELVNTPPTNTNDLFELTETLGQPEGQWGLAFNSYDPVWLLPWLAPYNGWLIDEQGNPTLSTLAMVVALTFYVDWHKLPGFMPPASYQTMRTAFLQGQLGMMIDGEWAIAELAQTDQVDWGVAMLPGIGPAQGTQPVAPLVLARYWAISRQVTGERAQAAAAFLEYISRPERQLLWTEQFGLLPTRRDALNDPIILTDPALRVSAGQMVAGRGVLLGVNTNGLLEAMRGPLAEALEGSLTPKQAVDAMQANLE